MEETTTVNNEATGPTAVQEEATGPTAVHQGPPGSISFEEISVEATPAIDLPAPVLTIDDLLNSSELIIKKEQDDKVLLESIGNMSVDELKIKLLSWAKLGFPNVYEIQRIDITPPTKCSDGVTRELTDYIYYCSGKPIQDHVVILQSKVSGMIISFAKMYGNIVIVVSKSD